MYRSVHYAHSLTPIQTCMHMHAHKLKLFPKSFPSCSIVHCDVTDYPEWCGNPLKGYKCSLHWVMPSSNVLYSTTKKSTLLCGCESGLVHVPLTSSETLFRDHHRKVLIHVVFKKTGPHAHMRTHTHVHTRSCMHTHTNTNAHKHTQTYWCIDHFKLEGSAASDGLAGPPIGSSFGMGT